MGMIKNLFFLAGKHRKRLKLIFSLMALRGAVRIIPIMILYLILMELLSADVNPWRILELTAYLAMVFLGINIWDHYMVLFTMKVGHEVCYDIRMNLGDKIIKLPLGFFVRRQTGELNTIMSEYVSRVEMFLSAAAPFMFSSLACALTMMAFFMILDWRMAFAAASVIPLALIAFTHADRIAERVTRAREESLRRTNSLIVEFIQGMPVIKIFNQVASRFRRFQDSMKDFRDKNIRAVIAVTIPSIILLTFTGLSIVILLPLGLYLYLKGFLPLSTFVFFIIAAPSFSDSVAHYLYGYLHVKSSQGQAMRHIIEVLEENPLHEPEDGAERENFEIEFVNVSFSYDERLVLEDVSFKIREGSIAALVGPSGAGKTTIVNLIARFWDVNSGEIRIGGQNIQEIKLDRLLSYISMVFQEVILFDDTIMENIRLGRRDATDGEVISAARAARCHEFIEELPDGYDTIIGERGAKLSGGEKQRISIARAILKDAPIVILDEATVFIDPENENLIQEAINDLTKDKTVIVIAHRLSTIVSADQIFVLDKGRIVERGCHNELLAANGLYRRLWDAHQSARGWKL
ncbi:MAG: ABC transporter ATP-binding protein [Halobacteriota archaeon]